MSDPGTDARERYERTLAKHIRITYQEAQKDIEAKLEEFKRKHKAKDDILWKKFQNGEITLDDYNNWLQGQLFQGKQWEAKRDQIIGVISDANKVATKIANNQRGNVFIANSNYQAYRLEHSAGVNFGFNLYDSSAVARLMRNWGGTILPQYKIDEPKDYIWNARVVNNSITQGIIQGERLDQVAKRLTDGLVTRNKNKMLTFARTGMTQAQNAGRLDRLDEAKKMGIKVHKEWMATLDERTRTTHQMLDGQKVPINKPFRVDNYTIKYPGDPAAHPAMVYNCRCTLVGDLDDYPSEYERYDNINGKPIKNMTYEEWKAAKSGAQTGKEPDKKPDRKFETIKRIMVSPTTAPMTDAQKAEFEAILNGMSEEHLDLYEAMTAFHDRSNYVDGPGWYSPSRRRVEMTLSKSGWEKAVGRKTAGAWKTKFHEELHQLDHILGITQGYGRYADITACADSVYGRGTPIGKRLETAIKKDIEDFINAGVDYYNSEHGGKVKHIADLYKPLPPGVRDAFFEYLELLCPDRQSKAMLSAFTDAVGLMTKGRIDPYSEGYWGHRPSYSKERGKNGATSECLAEIGSHIMRNDQEALDALSLVLPSSIKEYGAVIHEMCEYVKHNAIHY